MESAGFQGSDDGSDVEDWERELLDTELEVLVEERKAVEDTKRVSAQFDRLEMLFHAAQAKELADEQEALEEAERREEALDKLAVEAMQVERLMAEVSSGSCTGGLEVRCDEDGGLGSTEKTLGAECYSPEASGSDGACALSGSAVPPPPDDADDDGLLEVEVIDESDDEGLAPQLAVSEEVPALSRNTLVAMQCTEAHDSNEVLSEVVLPSDALPLVEQSGASPEQTDVPMLSHQFAIASPVVEQHDTQVEQVQATLRSHYLLLLERAAEQRRELNMTLAEIRSMEMSLGLVANATVSTASQASSHDVVPKPSRKQVGGLLKRPMPVGNDVYPDMCPAQPPKRSCGCS